MVAEFEADLIRSRTREGMKVAKAKGHLRGKQPKPNPRQEAHLVELLRTGEYTTAEVGDLFGVARATVYRAVQRSRTASVIAPALPMAAGRHRAPANPQRVRRAGQPQQRHQPRHLAIEAATTRAAPTAPTDPTRHPDV
jgi:transposase